MTSKKRYFTLAFIIVLLFASQAFSQEKALTIIRINPSGDDVPVAQQIVFEFNQAVVPVGKMERKPEEIPIQITPALNCQWRWLNTSSLACQLDEQAKFLPATKYSIKVSKGIKAQDGAILKDDWDHTFLTKRPEVSYGWFKNWDGPTEPKVYVTFDQEVTKASVEEHIFFKDANNNRYAATVDEEENPDNGEKNYLLAPKSALPAGTAISLDVEAGLKPVVGNELSIEAKSILKFATFDKFKFLGVRCTPRKAGDVQVDAEGEESEEDDSSDAYVEPVFMYVGDAEEDKVLCDPTSSVELLFNSPVKAESIKNDLGVSPDLKGGRTDFDPWEYVTYDYTEITSHDEDSVYSQYLPVPLKALDTYKINASANTIKDFFGRSLEEPISFNFKTDHRPARINLINTTSVMEKDVESHLPLYVTNLNKLSIRYESLTKAKYSPYQTKDLELFKARDIAYAYPVKVRELLNGQSGAIQGHIKSDIKTKTPNAGKWFFSQVTPFNIHAKLGHFNSLVWATKFSDGQPLAGAKVSIVKSSLMDLKGLKAVSKVATTDQNGVAKLEGLETLDPELKVINVYQNDKPRFFVKVEKDNDIAIMPMSYDFDLSWETLYPFSRARYGHMKSWGTTAQGVYKLGETVQYKIYVRNQDIDSFVGPKDSTYTLTINDSMGNLAAERKDIKLNEFGSLDGELELSKSWPVGYYTFTLKANFTNNYWYPMRVLVSDFTPASFRVTTELEKKAFDFKDKPLIKSLARLHAGGPYSDADLRVSAMISTSAVSFDDPKLADYEFGSGADVESKELYSIEDKLDSKGDFNTNFELIEEDVHHGAITFESSVSDERGKKIASTATAEYFSRDRFVGLKQDDWVIESGKPAEFKFVVVDQKGILIPNVNINLEMQYEQVKSAKVKSPGSAYLAEYDTEWVKVGECNVASQLAEVACNVTADKPGHYQFIAKVTDTKGKEQTVKIERYATGEGYVSWKSDSANSIQIVPEKNSYKPGETAKYLIKNPLPGAKALVSIERYGIISSYVKNFDKSTEILEVPVTEEYYPGYYVSVVLMAGRVDKPVENQVDLGKPSFRIGYAKTEVKNSSKELQLNISSEKPVYKPRDKATVDFELVGKQAKDAPVELAVAVLDEAVFDLIAEGKDYFDPFKGFYALDSIDVRNYNLLKQLIGRQKFEKKGANPGGGGGNGIDMRSIFKFVSYWNPSLKVSADGKASVSFDLPDNLTGWRVLAIAVDKNDRMGLGQGNFKVNQTIEIRPALPNIVREGDEFQASFSLMNRSEQAKTVTAVIDAEGALESSQKAERKITLEPFKRQNVSIPLKAVKNGEIKFQVVASDDKDRDSIAVNLNVLKSVALETAATYGSSTEKSVKENFLFPDNIRTDVGSVSVSLSPSVITGVDSAYEYMKEYPYSCWEQKITKAIMAAHYLPLKAYINKSFEWKDSQKLVDQTLSEAAAFQADNGGMTFFLPKNEFVSPYLSAYTSLAFTWFKKLGIAVPKGVEDKLDAYLIDYLKRDISPEYYSRGMTTSIRAVALAALASKNKIDIAELSRFESQVHEMDLFGKSHYLIAASSLGGTAEIQKKVVDMIMSTANETGGKYVFSEELDAVYTRVLSSLPRSQCAVLSALISSKAKLSDKLALRDDTFFKVVRSISAYRNSKGHWDSTQENVYCVNALVDYSSLFEKAGANYAFDVNLDSKSFGNGKFQNVQSEPVRFERAIESGDPGKDAVLEIQKTGPGRIYYQAALNYSPKDLKKDSINSGMQVKRELSVERNKAWELLKSPYVVNQGELVKVDLFVTVPAARNFVVVNDPIAGGFEALNSDLATTSKADLSKLESFQSGSFWFTHDSWMHFSVYIYGFYHKEIRHDSARFYSEYLQAGNYHLSYLAQAIAAGKYTMLPLKAEEMYDPDVFGQGIPEELEVKAVN